MNIRATWAVVAVLVPICTACADSPPADRIGFDPSTLNGQGLYGPADGLRALSYEYCIPEGRAYADEVATIDPTAEIHPGSPGRVGCSDDESLVTGNTQQPNFRDILSRLAGRPYVKRIEQSFFE
jgi:hypothetical protein